MKKTALFILPGISVGSLSAYTVLAESWMKTFPINSNEEYYRRFVDRQEARTVLRKDPDEVTIAQLEMFIDTTRLAKDILYRSEYMKVYMDAHAADVAVEFTDENYLSEVFTAFSEAQRRLSWEALQKAANE